MKKTLWSVLNVLPCTVFPWIAGPYGAFTPKLLSTPFHVLSTGAQYDHLFAFGTGWVAHACIMTAMKTGSPAQSITSPPEFIFYFFVPLCSHFWSIGLISQFLHHSQTVGLLGRVISSSQGFYLSTEKCTHTSNIQVLSGIRTNDLGL
jgi:hypothetical protein